jgi:hypothetical protein
MLKQIVIDTASTAQDWAFGTDGVSTYIDFVIQSEYGDNSWTEAMRIAKQTKAVTFAGDIYLSDTTNHIRTTTSNASDNADLRLGSAGDLGSDRGAGIDLYGNEHAYTGKVNIYTGNVTGGDITFQTGNSTRLTIAKAGDATFTEDISIPATKKLYLDGGSNTYITESASDTISFAAGMGGTALTLTALQATCNGSVRCGVNFQSSDGTSGANFVKSWEDPARDTHTVTIKDGLITSWVIAP